MFGAKVWTGVYSLAQPWTTDANKDTPMGVPEHLGEDQASIVIIHKAKHSYQLLQQSHDKIVENMHCKHILHTLCKHKFLHQKAKLKDQHGAAIL